MSYGGDYADSRKNGYPSGGDFLNEKPAKQVSSFSPKHP